MKNRSSSIHIIALLLVTAALAGTTTTFAQDPALPVDPAAADAGGPIDIQANEQEFAENQVIAKGNVRVKYKDSIISAPQAILMRNAAGAPQQAVFTGHPHLLQGDSSIDAETLTFDIINHKILAEGGAHSEVVSSAAEEDAPTASKPTIAKPSKTQAGERIITDADRQEYDQGANRFEASGHVRVVHGNIKVTSEKLKLVYGPNKKPETAIFTGRVQATQGQNNTQSDTMTYSLSTRRLQATGHVRSKVIQRQAQAPANTPATAFSGGPGAAHAATIYGAPGKEEVIIITSDSQDYSKDTGRISADGNVKVRYGEITGSGPQAILVRNNEGQADRVVFTGRSQINQPGKRWIADRIIMTMADKKVLAEGHTQAIIVQNTVRKQPVNSGSMLAGRPNTAGRTISASKIEATR